MEFTHKDKPDKRSAWLIFNFKDDDLFAPQSVISVQHKLKTTEQWKSFVSAVLAAVDWSSLP